ncbi:hypothetical protein NC651_023577 [Populus alba x Populus x berolinensis]|nr:hypothetical protein NC651_023577 [Populus alba x Populus x berolinensis]
MASTGNQYMFLAAMWWISKTQYDRLWESRSGSTTHELIRCSLQPLQCHGRDQKKVGFAAFAGVESNLLLEFLALKRGLLLAWDRGYRRISEASWLRIRRSTFVISTKKVMPVQISWRSWLRKSLVTVGFGILLRQERSHCCLRICLSPPISSLSFILFLLHFHSTISSPHFCAHDQSLSLLQFKESFSINSSASWNCQHPKTESWKEGTDCCLWDGVSCDLKTGHVTGLDLACSMLYGTLHSSSTLFSLHHLRMLDLSDNDFQSSHISSRFGQFSNLTHLNLNFSGFAGQVPSEISHLSKLVSLDLSINYFPSLEPISFDKLVRNLTKLRDLTLGYVNMSLVAPNSLTNLSSSLSSLSLQDCGLQGKFPGNIFLLPNLESLDLSYNEGLIGSFPSSNLSNISEFQHDSLTYLDLSNNHLHGPIPSLVFKQENLTTLILASNSKLTGEISSSICKLRFLRVLDLSNNNFSGFMPLCLGNFSNMLLVLHLGMNNLQGTIPSTFSNDNSLEYLNLNGNELEGKISLYIINCTMLEFLHLGNNKIEDIFPCFLETLPQLEILVLKSNKLQGFVKGPTTYNSFSKLWIFDISTNNFSRPLPTGYFNNLEAMMASDQNMIYMGARN